MKETNLNTILSNSFKKIKSKGQKISDPLGGKGVQNVFDLFFITPFGKIYFIESKLIKGYYNSFNFNLIEKHQYDNLLGIHFYMFHIRKFIKPVICVGWFVPYKLFEVLFLDIELIMWLKNQNINSIKKKQLLKIKEKNYFLPICSFTVNDKREQYIITNKIRVVNIKNWEKIFNGSKV